VLADLRDEIGSFKESGSDRARRSVIDLEDRDSLAGRIALRSWKEVEVVVEDLGQGCARRDVDDLARLDPARDHERVEVAVLE
jgi:hypothetical protein